MAEEQLAVKEYNLRTPPELTPVQSDWGGVVNYNVYSSAVSNVDGRPISINGVPLAMNGIPTKFIGAPLAFNGASATFDSKVLASRVGVIWPGNSISRGNAGGRVFSGGSGDFIGGVTCGKTVGL